METSSGLELLGPDKPTEDTETTKVGTPVTDQWQRPARPAVPRVGGIDGAGGAGEHQVVTTTQLEHRDAGSAGVLLRASQAEQWRCRVPDVGPGNPLQRSTIEGTSV